MLSKWSGAAYRNIDTEAEPKRQMRAKENKGRPVRWIWYIKWNPTGAYMLIKKLCEFNFEIPSAQRERNIIT